MAGYPTTRIVSYCLGKEVFIILSSEVIFGIRLTAKMFTITDFLKVIKGTSDTALCEMAKTQQRVNATEKQVENEKYAFRCFLIRLGFVGSEYKTERKILLKNLSGNSAFKNSAPPKAEEVTADE